MNISFTYMAHNKFKIHLTYENGNKKRDDIVPLFFLIRASNKAK